MSDPLPNYGATLFDADADAVNPKPPCPAPYTYKQTQNAHKYALLDLIFGPNLNNTHGIGSKAIVMNPSRLVAQSIPSLLYICTVNSGNAAPSTYLSRPFAAAALAPPNGPYVSIR